MYEFEFDELRQATCPCCGAAQIVLVRFVYRDGDARAVYKAWLSLGGHSRVADVLVVLGPWGEDDPIDERAEFRFHLWSDAENWCVSVIDADSPSSHAERTGRQLNRESALEHPWMQDVFDLSDEMVRHDQPLISYLLDVQPLN